MTTETDKEEFTTRTISVFELCPLLNDSDLIASEIKVHISDSIINARKTMGLNQKQFSKLLNVSQVMISKMGKWSL